MLGLGCGNWRVFGRGAMGTEVMKSHKLCLISRGKEGSFLVFALSFVPSLRWQCSVSVSVCCRLRGRGLCVCCVPTTDTVDTSQ